MMIEVSDECVDDIIGNALVGAYLCLKENIANPSMYHPDDIVEWKKLLPAIETVANWFMLDFPAAIENSSNTKL